MVRNPFTAEMFTPTRLRIGASVGAVVLCAALIGATAAPAATHPSATAAPRAAHGLLQIRFATPEPLIMPPPPQAGDQMAVLADVPVNLGFDPDLRASQDLALLRQADAVQAHDAQAQAALWAREESQMQAQIDATLRPPVFDRSIEPDRLSTVTARLGPSANPVTASGGDPEITASAGDTRKATPVAE